MIIKEDRDEILAYLEDSSNFREGSAEALYIPENEEEIREILTECSREKIPLSVASSKLSVP